MEERVKVFSVSAIGGSWGGVGKGVKAASQRCSQNNGEKISDHFMTPSPCKINQIYQKKKKKNEAAGVKNFP